MIERVVKECEGTGGGTKAAVGVTATVENMRRVMMIVCVCVAP